MEKETENKKPSVSFSNAKTYGQEIKALVSYFTGTTISTFVLERALEEVKENEAKLKELKEKLCK